MSDLAAMTDAELDEYAAMFDEYEGPRCPHCDGSLHGPTEYCWCIGCDACQAARQSSADHSAMTRAVAAEYARRHPTPPAAPPGGPSDDDTPF